MNTEHVSTTLSGPRLFAARIAWVLIAAVSLALLIALIPINWRTISFDWQVLNALPAVRPYLSVTSFTRYILVLRYLSLLTFLATAVLIFWRRSNDWMALLVSATLAAVPVAFNLGGYSETWAYYPQPWREVFRQLREALAAFVAMPGLLAVCFLFPNGRVFPHWLGRAAWILGGLVAAGILALALGAWLAPGWQFAADWGWWIFFLSFIAAMVVGLLGQVYRYRRVSGPIERQQTKWVLFSLGLFLGSNLLLGLSVIQLILSQFLEIGRYRALLAVIDLHWGLIVLTLIPVSIAFSILRYRLWDVDLIVNRALVYGALTAFIFSAYVVGVGLAGRILQTQESALVAILALIIVVPAIPPLRRRLQRGADRLLPSSAVAQGSRQAAEAPDVSETRLRGANLWVARAGWLALAAATVAITAALAPSAETIQSEWLVGQSLPAISGWVAPALYARYLLSLRAVVALIALATAALIAWRKSDDWLALLAALLCVFIPLSVGGSENWRAYPSPWDRLLENAGSFLTFLMMLVTIIVAFRFPDGAYAPRWMRWAAWVGGLMLIVGAVLLNSLGEGYYWVWIGTLLATVAAAVGGQVYRYRRVSDAVQRQQTKWVVGALALLPIWLATWFAGWFLIDPRFFPLVAVVNMHLMLAVFTAIPLAFAFSILRYRLWDIDVILNRTLAYSALTAAVIALYVITVGALGALFQTAGNVLLSILATGLIAILFNPLRQRLQGAVNRVMYGDRDDPATALARLGQRLETAVAPEAVLPSIVETVTQTLRVPYAEIELTTDDGRPLTVAHPSAVNRPPSIASFPLTFQSEALGHLRVAPRSPDEAFSAADRRLLEQIAQQAAPAVHAYRLTADLQRSRERIVTAREEERRRLRRDLHDGLGPALAGQALKLEAALEAVEADPAAARAQLAELKTQTQGLVADVRRLVYDLRPPVLDELGLVPALREQARRVTPPTGGLRVTVAAPEALPSLSAAVEVAAYRIAVEALTNVVRHAQARECVIEISAVDWHAQPFLMLEIVDDGVGLPAQPRPGVGLASMRERAAELGGACLVNPRKPNGVQVLAQLPILDAPAG